MRNIADIQTSFRLDTGPLIKFVLFVSADQPSRLVIVAHHLVIDQVSWSILLADLDRECRSIVQGKSFSNTKTTPLLHWTGRLRARANMEPSRLIQFWSAHSEMATSRIPRDFSSSTYPIEENSDAYIVKLDTGTTEQLLSSVSDAYQTRTDEIVLTALLQVLSKWMKQSAIRIDTERHGRENVFDDVDLSRTVGWFTAFFPTAFVLSFDHDPEQDIKSTKERLRAVPHGGLAPWSI